MFSLLLPFQSIAPNWLPSKAIIFTYFTFLLVCVTLFSAYFFLPCISLPPVLWFLFWNCSKFSAVDFLFQGLLYYIYLFSGNLIIWNWIAIWSDGFPKYERESNCCILTIVYKWVNTIDMYLMFFIIYI